MRAWLSILAIGTGVIFWGVWRGEDSYAGPFDYTIDIVIAQVCFFASILVAWKARRIRAKAAVFGIVIPVALAVGLYSGHQDSQRAFNECVQRGETVRVALGEYFSDNGRYPQALDSLQMEDSPGGRFLRGSILRYKVTGEGYQLSFGDWLVTHVATDSLPFTAYK